MRDKSNIIMAKELILKAKRMERSDKGKRAMNFNDTDSVSIERDYIVDTLNDIYKLYDEADNCINKVTDASSVDDDIDAIKILIKRNKNIISNKLIFI